MKKLIIIIFTLSIFFITSCDLLQNTMTAGINYRVITNKKNITIEYLDATKDRMYLNDTYTTASLPNGGQWMKDVTLVRGSAKEPINPTFKMRITGEGDGYIFVGFDGGFASEYLEEQDDNTYKIKLNEDGSIPTEILEHFSTYKTTTENAIEIEEYVDNGY